MCSGTGCYLLAANSERPGPNPDPLRVGLVVAKVALVADMFFQATSVFNCQYLPTIASY